MRVLKIGVVCCSVLLAGFYIGHQQQQAAMPEPPQPVHAESPNAPDLREWGNEKLLTEVQVLKKEIQKERKALLAQPKIESAPRYYWKQNPDGTLERKVLMRSSKFGVAPKEIGDWVLPTPTEPVKPATFLPMPEVKNEPDAEDEMELLSCYKPARKRDS